MADAVYGAVKVLHVVCATLWVGGAAWDAFVVRRALGRAPPDTRRNFGAQLVAPTARLLNAAGGLTVLSGLVLVYRHPHGFSGLTASTWGKLVLFSLIAGLLALYLLNFAIRPTFRAIAKIQAEVPPEMPPPANLRFFQARLRVASLLHVGILVAVLATMTAANVVYFGPP